MEKIAYKNKFRILSPTDEIVRINSMIDRNGVYRFIEGFDTLAEAQGARALHCNVNGFNENEFTIEPYPQSIRLSVPVIKDEAVNAEIERRKIFNGKGLEYNTSIRRKDEVKYRPDKFYTREIWFAQSLERNKGMSALPKFKRKKNEGLNDTPTFEKIENLQDSSFIESKIIESLSRKKFANRKELKDYLRPRGFKNRSIERLFHQLTMVD